MSGEIAQNSVAVNDLLQAMDQAKNTGLKLETTIENLANAVESNFKGEASESLLSLLEHETERIRQEKDNLQKIYEKAQNAASEIEAQDNALSQAAGPTMA